MTTPPTASPAALDHLVLAVPELARGVAWAERRLGVAFGPGGAHPGMGTHNRLLRLGADAFLEVIAPAPDAPAPPHPRWFGMSDADALRRRWERGPHLAAWVARVPDLDAASAVAPDVLGRPVRQTRGALSWRFALRADGAPPLGGAAPCLIQWDRGAGRPDGTPAPTLPDAGCALERLTVHHPDPPRVAALLDRLGLAGVAEVVVGEPGVSARVRTPGGTVEL